MSNSSHPDSSSSSTSEIKPLHPVYTVTKIQNKIRPLDGETITYSSWTKLFKLHVRGYKVSHHIDGTPSPAKTDAAYDSWSEIDAIVLQWIYGTLEHKILVRVLEHESTAQEAWDRVKNMFLSNKQSRAAALEIKFTNMTLAKCASLEDYCQKLKELSDQLEDVDHKVEESRLVIQLVQGLPLEYAVAGALINQKPTTWDEARNQLDAERQRIEAQQRETPSNNLALLDASQPTATQQTTQSQFQSAQWHPTHGSSSSSQNINYQNSSYNHNTFRGRGRSNRGRGRGTYDQGRNSGSYWKQQSGPWNGQPQYYPPSQQQWNGFPSSPHPAQPPSPWDNMTTPTYSSQSQPHNPMANLAYQAKFGNNNPSVNPLCPTDLGVALQAVNLNPNEQPWHMDLGASLHLTSNPGIPNWKDSFAP